MFFVDNRGEKDPALNLAFEEYCFKYLSTKDQSYFILYENDASVVVGKHQNTFYEINHEYARKHDVKVMRRISGGGAVYHGRGNLNYSFITPFTGKRLGNIQHFLKPIADMLSKHVPDVLLTDKNDILIRGKKISGSAQFTNMKNVLTHGTLLFNADLDKVRASLKPDLEILSSSGIESRRASVTNISEETSSLGSYDEFRHHLLEAISLAFGPLIPFSLGESSWEEIADLAKDKYSSWEWVYGKSPLFCVRHPLSRNGGSTKPIDLDVKRGVIKKIHESGKETKNSRKLEEKWVGKIYEPIKLAL